MAVRVVLPTFVTTTLWRKPADRARRFANFSKKSTKTTKSDPSTGDQLGKGRYIFVSSLFNRIPCRPVGKRRE